MVCRIAVLKDIACKCAKGTVYVMRRSAVQRLYEICKETFSGNDIFNAVPPPEAQLHRLRSFLDTIKPADVGLDENEWLDRQPRFGNSRTANRRGSRHSSSVQARWPPPPVTYVHVYQCNEFSIGIFCLPTSAVIPLHDHPGMTVCSKILYGSMHIKAYDWTYPANIRRNTCTVRLANLKVDTVFRAPCGSSTLYPTTGGNIHRFTAVTSCAVLDVFFPPYSADPSAGRNISYYREYPYRSRPPIDQRGTDSTPNPNFAWLEAVEQPDEFIVRGGEYMGPLVMEMDDESSSVSEVGEG